MLRSLLLALDDTAGARAARDLAFALARRSGAAVAGLVALDRPHTRDLREPVPPGAAAFAAQRNRRLAEALEAEAAAVIEAARAAAGDLPFTIIRREEAPEPALLAEGAAHDLLVLGRDSTLGREIAEEGLSPTVEALVRDAARPLLVVPPGAVPCAEGPVLVAYSGSLSAMRTVQLFALLGLGAGQPVRLLDLTEGAPALPALAAYLRRHGCAVTPEAAEDQGGEALVALAAAMPARLLVLGAAEEGGLSRLVFGSATARLLRAAPCPVFIQG